MPRTRVTVAAALALAAVWLMPAAARAGDEPFRMLSVPEVEGLLKAPDARIYDANNRKQFEKARLPGATFVSYKDVGPKDLPADKATRLVFYCKNPG